MRILIVKLSSIGDVIHTLPALAELRRRFPSAEVSWVVERSSAELLRESPMLDHLIEINTRAWRQQWQGPRTWREVLQAVEDLRKHQFDIGFDFQGLLKSGLVLYLSRARRRVGFETTAMRERQSRVFLTQQVPVSDEGHVIEKNLQLIRVLGIERSGPYQFPMSIPEEDRQIVEWKLKSLGIGSFAIINPGGNWKGKRWSPENYAALCQYLYHTHRLVSVVTHAPDEEELAWQVTEGGRPSAIAFPCTLKQLAVLADRASLFVGGDTGPLHLAAARGAPIVAIFGATLARRNGPFFPDDVVVQDPDAMPEAYYRRSNDDHYINVPLDQVQQAIERRLARASKAQPNQDARTATDGSR
ncbi:MAG: lipopolysaccharide heptosyltransferase I [Acidobacteria bacterium]|nr:lipopolysaccharide heptosyltransferase I [Acidobacteriota bacterium]